MSIALTGLGGFDSSGVVTQLVELARRPINEIDTQRNLIDSASSTLNTFSTRLVALKNAATALSTPSGFTSAQATSSDAAVVASVNGSSPVASYTVEVTRLARAQKLRSDVQTSSTEALGFEGSLAVKVGDGEAKEVSILATDTLTDVARKISASGARVSASVVGDGSSFRLLVQGLDTGAANAFTVTQTGVDLGLEVPENLYETAANAALTVDGIAVERPTNSVSGVIPGVTLALTKETTAPVKVGVASDAGALTTKIEAFIKAYNDVVSAGQAAAGFGSIKASNRYLAGDAAIRRSLDRIGSMIASPVTGARANMLSLASVGIRLSAQGQLSLDRSKLEAALKNDPEGVRRLFVEDATVGSTGLMTSFAETVDGLVSGTYAPIRNRLATFAAQRQRLTESRAAKEERVAVYEASLKKQFATLELAMSRYQALSTSVASIGKGFGGDNG